MNKNIRMDALKAAGIDTNSFISITGIKPGDTISLTLGEDGNMIMNMSDSVVNSILENGYVKNTKLYRRWIAAQTLRILWKVEHDGFGARYSSYDDYIKRNYKYMYQFRFMEDEIKVLAELEKADKESFEERVHFFDKRTIVQIYNEYMSTLRVSSASAFAKGRIIELYDGLATNIGHMNYSEIYDYVKWLNRNLVDLSALPENRLANKIQFSKTWLDTFKGEGAYYTLKNLVLFHGLEIRERTRSYYAQPVIHKGREAFKYIERHLDEYKNEGWRFMAMLKKCLADNNFDVTKLY